MSRSDKNDLLRAMQATLGQKMEQANRTPLDDFAGLSPVQMAALRDDGFGGASPIRWCGDGQAADMPLCVAMRAVLDYFAEPKGAKLTPQGRLPRRLLVILHDLHQWDIYQQETPPAREEYLPVAELLHALIVHRKLVRKRNGCYLLTRKGQEWQTMAPETQARWMMEVSVQGYNWGYLDGYPELPSLQHGWGFIVWLLLCFGSEQRSADFYADKVLNAWPFLLEGLDTLAHTSPRRCFGNIFEIRVAVRWLAWLGLVSFSRERRPDAELMIRPTSLFFQCWGLRR